MSDNKESLIRNAIKQVKNRFEEIRRLHYNQNTKGYDYEKICKEFFEIYLGSLYEFYIRASVVDYEGKYNVVFKQGENEFDVVATYKTAIPKIVLEIGHGIFIPLDAVAFISEIKQTLTKTSLNEDLEKFKKLSTLPVSQNRMGSMGWRRRVRKGDEWGDKFVKEGVPIPKILIYYESEIDEQFINEMLNSYKGFWDAIVLVKDDNLFLNPDSVLNYFFESDQMISIKEYSLFWLLILISLSLPIPSRVLTVDFFINSLLSKAEMEDVSAGDSFAIK